MAKDNSRWTDAAFVGAFVPLLLCLSGCESFDSLVCGGPNCEFSREEWLALTALSGLGEPPADRSNKYIGQSDAISLGQKFYFDSRFSGDATQLDMLKRPTPYARAAIGQPTGLSCSTCHSPSHAGVDATSIPGNVSVGAGFYDVNSQPTINAAYYPLLYWNGRVDSLWAQAVAVSESFVSMNGNRLSIGWTILDKYKNAYELVFKETPLPFGQESSAAQRALLQENGRCKRGVGDECPPAVCHETAGSDASMQCVPRFPMAGRPGTKMGCQLDDRSEPFGDAYDCMTDADKESITRVLVNFGKAIAAYEYSLVSRNSAFDLFVAEGPRSTKLSPAAQRGARLFVGKADCVECHSTPLFSNGEFENVAVPQVGPGVPTESDCPESGVCDCVNGKNCLPWGAWDGLSKLKSNGFRRDSHWSDDPNDKSRAEWVALTLDSSLKGAWRTPSLRDVALTAPYMHNGIFKTLAEVVHHYNQGGDRSDVVGSPAKQMQPLGLSDIEQADLVAFLESLTGAALPAALIQTPALP